MIKWIYEYNLSPEENIRRDFELLNSFEDFDLLSLIRVHTYGSFCATTGYFTRLRGTTIRRFEKHGIPLLRRVTGGSVALHGEDLCMSFFIRTGGDMGLTYNSCLRVIRDITIGVMKEGTGFPIETGESIWLNRKGIEFCAESAIDSDIFSRGNKIAGFAGRVRKNKFLLHLQIHSAGWDSVMLKNVAGLDLNLHRDYYRIKKFVFSNNFLENIKIKIGDAFYGGLREIVPQYACFR